MIQPLRAFRAHRILLLGFLTRTQIGRPPGRGAGPCSAFGLRGPLRAAPAARLPSLWGAPDLISIIEGALLELTSLSFLIRETFGKPSLAAYEASNSFASVNTTSYSSVT